MDAVPARRPPNDFRTRGSDCRARGARTMAITCVLYAGCVTPENCSVSYANVDYAVALDPKCVQCFVCVTQLRCSGCLFYMRWEQPRQAILTSCAWLHPFDAPLGLFVSGCISACCCWRRRWVGAHGPRSRLASDAVRSGGMTSMYDVGLYPICGARMPLLPLPPRMPLL